MKGGGGNTFKKGKVSDTGMGLGATEGEIMVPGPLLRNLPARETSSRQKPKKNEEEKRRGVKRKDEVTYKLDG